MAERVARHLSERLDQAGVAPCIAAHHGSLARERRLAAGRGSKEGSLRAPIADEVHAVAATKRGAHLALSI